MLLDAQRQAGRDEQGQVAMSATGAATVAAFVIYENWSVRPINSQCSHLEP